jgi:hypothetical protein
MKIKDIVAEGVLDFAKGLWNTGSIEGAKAASQQAQATKEIKPFIDSIINSWNRYVGLTGKKTAADAVEWANTSFKSDISSINPPANDSVQEINRFLTDVSKSYRAGALKSTAGTGRKYKSRQSAITPIQPTTPQTPASSAPSMAGKYGKSATAAQTPTQAQGYQSPFGVTIKASSDRGHVLTYKNKNYWLNDRGMWANDGKNSPSAEASAQLQAEMTKVMDADLAMNKSS